MRLFRPLFVPVALTALVPVVAQCGGKTSSAPPSDASPSGPLCTATAAAPSTLVQPTWLARDATLVAQVSGIAVSDTDVFYGLFEASSIWRVPIRGGTPTMLSRVDGDLEQLLATPTGVVFARSGAGADGAQAGEIDALPATGGSATTLASFHWSLRGFVTDGTNLYFSDTDGTKAVPLAGGTVQLLTSQTGTLGIAGTDLLIADESGGNVFRVPEAGGPLTTVATGQQSPSWPVSCGGADVCWINDIACAGVPAGVGCNVTNGEGALVRMTPGGSPVTIAESVSLYGPTSMVFDGSRFFVTVAEDASFDGPLSIVPASGGTAQIIGSADNFVVSGGCIFDIDFINGVTSFVVPSN